MGRVSARESHGRGDLVEPARPGAGWLRRHRLWTGARARRPRRHRPPHCRTGHRHRPGRDREAELLQRSQGAAAAGRAGFRRRAGDRRLPGHGDHAGPEELRPGVPVLRPGGGEDHPRDQAERVCPRRSTPRSPWPRSSRSSTPCGRSVWPGATSTATSRSRSTSTSTWSARTPDGTSFPATSPIRPARPSWSRPTTSAAQVPRPCIWPSPAMWRTATRWSRTASEVAAVMPTMEQLFLGQGYAESWSESSFDDYLAQGAGKTPMLLVYESQFLELRAAAGRLHRPGHGADVPHPRRAVQAHRDRPDRGRGPAGRGAPGRSAAAAAGGGVRVPHQRPGGLQRGLRRARAPNRQASWARSSTRPATRCSSRSSADWPSSTEDRTCEVPCTVAYARPGRRARPRGRADAGLRAVTRRHRNRRRRPHRHPRPPRRYPPARSSRWRTRSPCGCWAATSSPT